MTSAPLHVEFGYLPEAHDFSVGYIAVSTLPGLAGKRIGVEKSDGVENGWIYAPPQRVLGLFGERNQQARRPENIILELQNLVSRFVCAILGLPCPDAADLVLRAIDRAREVEGAEEGESAEGAFPRKRICK